MTADNSKKWLERLQFMGWAMLLIGLPLSNFLMSLSVFGLSGVFVLYSIHDYFFTKKRTARIKQFISPPYIILFISIYGIFLLALFWSSNWEYGLKDLKIKLPILILPLIAASLNPMGAKAIRTLFVLFVSSLVAATLICLSVYIGMYEKIATAFQLKIHEVKNIRDISIFISHIRFSLLLVVGICVLLTQFFKTKTERLISLITIGLFLYFLWVIESITGFSILIILLFLWLVRLIFMSPEKYLKRTGISALLIMAISLSLFFIGSYTAYFRVAPSESKPLETFSSGGERYEHHPESNQIENGHYVMNYIAWGEMTAAWSERSAIPIDSIDAAGNIVKGTLIRYLTSKGLRKDSAGVMQLTADDIQQIENGIPNATWKEKNGIQLRMERIFFEYNNYRLGGNPGGHSVFQRFAFWHTAWQIIREHPVWGVGTGDVADAFAQQYEKSHSPIDAAHRLRAHNQYLTVWLSTGILGLIWFLYVIVFPFTQRLFLKNTLFLCFWITALLSFFTEDTLESQAGVSFFTFLTCFLIFLPRKP